MLSVQLYKQLLSFKIKACLKHHLQSLKNSIAMRTYLSKQQNSSLSLSEKIALHVFVFKTNISYKKDIRAIAYYLNSYPSIIKWNIDREDIDKILRVESLSNNAGEIINTIQLAGYCCEELSD
jgi:hypothetical protein